MQVLVCRPEKDAVSLKKQLSLSDFCVHSLPTIKIIYRSISEDFRSYTSIIFTSKYTVESLFKQYSPKLFTDKTIYSVGSSTASILGSFGIKAKYPTNSNSKQLLKLILHKNISKEKFGIISGAAGNDLLVKEISKLTTCKKLEIYQRVFEDLESLSSRYNKLYTHKLPELIITTSLDVFKSLNRIFKKTQTPKDAIVTITSPKMLNFVNHQGFKNTLRLERLDNNYISKRILEFTEVNKNVNTKT